MKWMKILGVLALFCLIFLGGFLILAYLAFLPFEHREDHNGVGWAKFARSIEKEIKRSEFVSDDFSQYEGTVMTGTLRSTNKSIQLQWLQRGSYLDARDMNTLKEISIHKINDKTINCFDEENHHHHAKILSKSIPTQSNFSNYSSISEILSGYDDIAKVVLAFPETEYTVSSGKVQNMPSWLSIKPNDSSCHKHKHEIEKLTCRVE